MDEKISWESLTHLYFRYLSSTESVLVGKNGDNEDGPGYKLVLMAALKAAADKVQPEGGWERFISRHRHVDRNHGAFELMVKRTALLDLALESRRLSYWHANNVRVESRRFFDFIADRNKIGCNNAQSIADQVTLHDLEQFLSGILSEARSRVAAT